LEKRFKGFQRRFRPGKEWNQVNRRDFAVTVRLDDDFLEVGKVRKGIQDHDSRAVIFRQENAVDRSNGFVLFVCGEQRLAKGLKI
jgi:hypothetical protein